MDRQGDALAWGITMHDPLLPDQRRRQAVDRIDQIATDEPAWAVVFFGGVAADIAGTLPAEDRWRSLGAKVGSLQRGSPRLPPGVAGATWPDGATFGEWVDFTDVAPLVSDVPETDPELAAVADPIDAHAAAIVPFAFDGWRSAAGALDALRETGAPLGPAGREAVRMLIIRRRSYGVEVDDPWIFESVYEWGWRTGRIAEGDWEPDDIEIESRISQQRIR